VGASDDTTLGEALGILLGAVVGTTLGDAALGLVILASVGNGWATKSEGGSID